MGLSPEKASLTLSSIETLPNPNESQQPDHTYVQSKQGGRQLVARRTILPALTNPMGHIDDLAGWLLRHLILKLDGSSRVTLVNQQAAGDLQKSAVESLGVSFRNKQKREEVRRIIYEASASYFVIDPIQLGMLRIRLSPRPPADEMEELNIHPAGIPFIRKRPQ
ncbi:hypothetical protein [Bradyrhizobium nanningense]|uniref:hypothetical protein n=1 Tax=Bradyrhizobium nanningense TaxID=1325118 RepID=UPI001008E07C|nr:hypothetical protein [Bradyrhizobium nanningense]